MPRDRDRTRTSWRKAGPALLLLAAIVALVILEPGSFTSSLLFVHLVAVQLAIGSLGLVLLHHLTGGRWGEVLRPALERVTGLFPWLLLLLVPILLDLPNLYPWANPEAVRTDPHLQHLAPYLNPLFFIGRSVFYVLSWWFVSWLVRRFAGRAGEGPKAERRLRRASGLGLIYLVFSATFASIDWGMSLEPHTFSAAYGIYFVIGSALMALALAVVTVTTRSPERFKVTSSDEEERHPIGVDLGNLMLTFVLLWTYVGFMQFLIIWSGNLPEEVLWYTVRTRGGWALLPIILVLFHFLLPFTILLSREAKKIRSVLLALATLVLALRIVDLTWSVTPALSHVAFVLPLQGLLLLLLGGIFSFFFLEREPEDRGSTAKEGSP